MARYLDGVCRNCRREKVKLYLKGDRCYSEKCALERLPYPPGQHGQKRGKLSDYGQQLREKQKARRVYGVGEKQFRNYVIESERLKGVTSDNLVRILECRLDNMIFRMGFACSRNEARQLVHHRHFTVNNRIVDVPSFLLKVNDVIEPKEKSKKVQKIVEALDGIDKKGVKKWIELDKTKMQGRLVGYPNRDDVDDFPVNERSVVEYYSK